MDRGGQEQRRVIQALLVLAINDTEFLDRLRERPASTLSDYGLALRDEETDRVFRYLIAHAGSSDEQILADLRSLQEGTFGTAERRW